MPQTIEIAFSTLNLNDSGGLCESLAAVADPPSEEGREAIVGGPVPAAMAEMIRWLQRDLRHAEAARLHPTEGAATSASSTFQSVSGGTAMLDIQSVAKQPIPSIEVADYIEMGRVVAQWATDPASRPQTVAELRRQLEGIALVPERIKEVSFVQSTLDHLVLRLPVEEMFEESLERVTDPMGDAQYPLPQFYADHLRPGFGPVMTPLDTLLARVGDFTIAQCR